MSRQGFLAAMPNRTEPLTPVEHPAEAPLLTPVEVVPGKALYKTVLPGVMCSPCGQLGLKGSKCPLCGKDTIALDDVI
ncbi:hypothetical protein LCGC14_2725480, partial [marine sediment metagenome]